MAGITLAQAEAKLQTWLEAEDRIASGQRYRIGDRELARADLAEVRKSVEYWNGKVKELQPGQRRVRFGVPG